MQLLDHAAREIAALQTAVLRVVVELGIFKSTVTLPRQDRGSWLSRFRSAVGPELRSTLIPEYPWSMTAAEVRTNTLNARYR